MEVPTPIFPPDDMLGDCTAPPVSRIEDVIGSLVDLVECEHASNAALRAWVEERRSEAPD